VGSVQFNQCQRRRPSPRGSCAEPSMISRFSPSVSPGPVPESRKRSWAPPKTEGPLLLEEKRFPGRSDGAHGPFGPRVVNGPGHLVSPGMNLSSQTPIEWGETEPGRMDSVISVMTEADAAFAPAADEARLASLTVESSLQDRPSRRHHQPLGRVNDLRQGDKRC
jgi:hypothetical protein